jgi:hypothetical protein
VTRRLAACRLLAAGIGCVAASAWSGPAAAADGAAVRVVPSPVDPGGIAAIVVDDQGVDPASITATFEGRTLAFFSGSDGRPRALAGIELTTKPGPHRVVVDVRPPGTPARRLEGTVAVRARTFPRENLQVSRKYVAPDPATVARIAREQKVLDAILARRSDARLWKGSFALPADGPLGSPFGLRRFFNGEPRRPHMGQDIRVPVGTPVHAAARGRVVLADDQYFGGNTLVLDHGLGLFTLYLHLVSFRVSEGTLVDRGELIGSSGKTGRVTGPHLHWGAYVSETRVDPLPLLRDPAAERTEGEDGEQDRK